ncbi:hypothetical protein PILCRDRAFT_824299 [Piloderma croceum F 1598]|uniref:Uncharacterized protein n=1 Tax=Piloderma croceum (strain F 1598) TaxID=765440 RepID=A0A0C3AWM2_PILCF|nr:hypothetical protein PILCRDRAFT_824299 [Piloderma croceum F 1598]
MLSICRGSVILNASFKLYTGLQANCSIVRANPLHQCKTQTTLQLRYYSLPT